MLIGKTIVGLFVRVVVVLALAILAWIVYLSWPRPATPAIHSGPPPLTERVANQVACGTINADFYYPTVPASGEHVSLQQATQIERLLKKATAPRLNKEAEPLQKAIDTNNEGAMIEIISSVQTEVCGPLGYPPAT